MPYSDDLFFKIYKILNSTLYGEEVNPNPYYKDQTILGKKLTEQKYEISYELLTVYQAGAIAFQTMLNIEAYKNTDISELSQILLQEAFHLSPVKLYQYDLSGGGVDEEIFKQSYRNISHPNIGIEHDILWQHMLRKISHTSLASVWALFIPFLEKSFLKGLCPFSFYYHVTMSKRSNFVIQIAQRILDAEQHFSENMPSPLTYSIFENVEQNDVQKQPVRIDSLTQIIKSCCEKE